ncbi:hypothetical protein CRG98_021713 [Punica granatum]|uniref:Uncharacterized protein n=1 Tax=Punica granatum TaxID=22663 RepID=A0A2I0JNL6_PUNGR|nr:hypothetical protein CRG98_021713 [Punica granatum]
MDMLLVSGCSSDPGTQKSILLRLGDRSEVVRFRHEFALLRVVRLAPEGPIFRVGIHSEDQDEFRKAVRNLFPGPDDPRAVVMVTIVVLYRSRWAKMRLSSGLACVLLDRAAWGRSTFPWGCVTDTRERMSLHLSFYDPKVEGR